MRNIVKRIFAAIAVLLHLCFYADSITLIQPQRSLENILSDSGTTIGHDSNNNIRTIYVSNPITISNQHTSFRHHTATPQYDLHRMSTEQLAWYFYALQYTEDEVLSHPMLYTRQAYLTIAKQLPRYPEFVEKYYKQYCAYSRLFKIWETMHFRYCKGLAKWFESLYRECEKKRKAQEAHEQKVREECAQEQRRAYEKKETEVREAYMRELRRVEIILNDSSACKSISINNHKTRVATIKMTQEQPDRTLHTLQTNQEAIDFVAAYGITEQQIAHVTLNSYEHQLHKEFVSHIHSTLALQRKYTVSDQNIFIDALGSGIALGMQSNYLHNPECATRWSDFCYEATEIVKGIGEGIVLGSYNTVDMVAHPVRTLVRIVDGVRMLGSLTARTVGTLAHLNWLIERGEYLQCATEVCSIGEQLGALAMSIAEHSSHMSNHDIAKHITAFGTEWVLTGQMFAMGHILCSNMGQVIQRTIRLLKEESKAGEFVLATVDGVLMKASENINKVGGGVSTIVRNGCELLEIMCAEYITNIAAELEMLQLIFSNKIKGVAELANKYIKIDCKHILGIDLSFTRRGRADIGGFHHDLIQAIEKADIIKFANKVIHENGCYSADLVYMGEIIKPYATFFPSEWSREKVVSKIYEAYENFAKSGAQLVEKGGKYLVDGKTNEGIRIRMYIKKNGLIVTAFPVLK